MAGIWTKTEGLDELVKAFYKLGSEAVPFMTKGINEAGEVVLAKARQKAPIGKMSGHSGTLKKGIERYKIKFVKNQPFSMSSLIGLSEDVQYGVSVELGHQIIRNGKSVGIAKAKPFLRPAADESREEVIKIMSNALDKALDELGGQ